MYRRKIDAFIGLSECCVRIHKFSKALIFLKKALQYSWYTGCIEKELLIYDKIGLIHFNLQDLKKAQFYHQR